MRKGILGVTIATALVLSLLGFKGLAGNYADMLGVPAYAAGARDVSGTDTMSVSPTDSVLTTDKEKIEKANGLLGEVDELLEKIDAEIAKGKDANTDRIAELFDEANAKIADADKLLDSVTDKKSKDYESAVQNSKDTQTKINKKEQEAYDTVPFADDGSGNLYAFGDINVVQASVSDSDAKKYIQMVKNSTVGKSADFTNAVVYDIVLVSAKDSNVTLTLLNNRSCVVDIDMSPYTKDQLSAVKLFHIDAKNDNKVEAVDCSYYEESGKRYVRFNGSSFSPYVLTNIKSKSSTSTGSTTNNPKTNEISQELVMLGVICSLGAVCVAFVLKKTRFVSV